LLIARRPIIDADFQTIRGVVLNLERRLDLLEKRGDGLKDEAAEGKSRK
jgi:hypothetical protein